jgi:hypothetical protein
MSDNNLDIRARLTGEDRLSATVVKLLAKIKSLEQQMAKLGKNAKNAITDIPMEDYVKKINATSKAMNGLTRKHLDWAKANGVAGDKAQLTWAKLTNEIQRLQKEHEKWTNSTARGAKKRAKLAQDELNTQYKNAVAYKYLYNKVGDQRLDIQRRVTEQLGNLEAAHLRNQERHHANHLRNISRMRREAMRSMSSLANIGNRSGPYAAAAAGAAGFAGVGAFRTRMRVDTSETNLRMFGQMSQAEVREMRQQFGNRAAIKYGMTPDKMIDAYTEVIKANVPKDRAREVADTIMQSTSGLDIDLKETTRYATRIATLTQDMKNLDPAKLKSMLNAVAVAGIESAADTNEIIAANRRASGVFATSKMSPEDLNAFTGTGVGVGLPSAKVGTMLGFIVNEIVGAKNTRGQRAQDLSKAANLLGFGGRANISAQMAANPADTLMKIFNKVGGMSEQNQNKILTLLGMREWRDELAAMVEARENIADLLEKIRDPKNSKRLEEINDQKLKSLAGRWKSLVAAMTIMWESVGAGFEKAFGQITEFFTDYLGKLDTKKITDTVEAFTDGIVAGLGFDSWTDMLKAAFGDPESVKSWSKEVFGFVKGFMSGMKEMFTVISTVWTGLMTAFGVNTADPESVGKFTARLIEFGVALKAIGSLAQALEGIVTFVKGLAAVVALGAEFWTAVASGGILGALIGRAGSRVYNWWNREGAPEEPQRKPGENNKDFQKRIDEYTLKRLYHKSSYTGPTDFSGRRRSRVDDLADSLDKFGGRVERAAFIGNAGGGLSNAFYTGGSGKGLSTAAFGGGLGGGAIGGLPGLLKSVPGAALPGIGSGGIIRRDSIPSFNGTGGSLASAGELNRSAFEKVFAGTALAGKYDQVVAAAKANGVEPSLLAGVMAQESGRGKFLSGNNPGGVMDPATGWSRKMQFADLDAGISKTASVLAKNYKNAGGDLNKLQQSYAPIGAANDPGGLNGNWLSGVKSFSSQMGGGNGAGSAGSGDAVGFGQQYLGMNEYSDTQKLAAMLGADPRGKSNAWCARFVNKSLAAAGGQGTGSAVANSFQRWGSSVNPSDVKRNDVLLQTHGLGYNQPGGHVGLATGETRMQNGRLQVKMLAGNDGDSVREHWIDVDNNLMVRRGNSGVPQGLTDKVGPSSLIQNVPPPSASPVAGGMQSGGYGGGGPVNIHINGSSHDPEALATMVQRRIDESMNWRTHDTASEYT